MPDVMFEEPLPLTAQQRAQGVVECRELTLGGTVVGRLARYGDGRATLAWHRASLVHALEAIVQAEWPEILTLDSLEW